MDEIWLYHYDPEKRQNNNEWSGGIAAHPVPSQKIPRAKVSWKSSCLEFSRSRRHPPHWLSSKGPNYQRGVLLIFAGAIEWHFEGKNANAAGRSPRGSCSCTTIPRLTGHLQPRRNWPTWAFSVLITSLFSGSGPVRLPPLPWTEKNKWKVTIFLPMRRSSLPWRSGSTDDLLNFFEWLAKLEQWAKKCIELRGEYAEQIPSLVTVACFLPGQAKDYQHPLIQWT